MTDTPATSTPTALARAAEAVATTAANGWTAIIALAPSINGVVSALAIPLLCVLLGIGGAVGYQKATASLSLPAAAPDLPKSLPTPVVSMENLGHALEGHCGKLEGKIDEVKKMLEPKGSVKRTSGKK